MVLLAVLPGLSGLGQSCEYLATLTVDSFPAVQSGLTTYRVYLVTPDSNQYVTRVGAYDDAFADLILSVPSGAYNSVFGGVTAELIIQHCFLRFQNYRTTHSSQLVLMDQHFCLSLNLLQIQLW